MSRTRMFATMAISAFLAAGSNLVLRFGMASAEVDGLLSFALAVATPAVFLGLCGYGLSFLLWLNVLAQARLSAAFPVYISTSFAMVVLGAVTVLGETLSVGRILGAVLIAAGIVVAEWREPHKEEEP